MSKHCHSMDPHNHDVFPEDAPLVNVQIDGKWVQVPKGMNVVEAAKMHGKFIPHYCYHPKLSISGNCRMCLVETGSPKLDAERKPVVGEDGKPELAWMPRPQIGCATTVNEGMGIRTDSQLVKECRNGVMEFLLINHPLDCPICDQAGECKLQEFSVQYGHGESRFDEEKVHKPKNVDIGERIVLDDERCILCSRCVRYAREVLDDDVFGFVERGSHNTLTVHPDRRFDNDYSLNTVDICPVGALTSKDFRFKMRVWFLKETQSFCTGCATGCNITVGSRENVVHRLTPRQNDQVNSLWMCDQGRLGFHYLHDENRLSQPLIKKNGKHQTARWSEVQPQVTRWLNETPAEQIGVLASGQMTNEELFLLKEWMNTRGVQASAILPRTWKGDKFLKSEDRNPNTQGARMMGFESGGTALEQLKAGVREGRIKVLLVLHEDAVMAGFSPEELSNLSSLIYVGLLPNEGNHHADYLLPASGFTEKRGSMINIKGRLQRLNQATQPPDQARDDWELLEMWRSQAQGKNPLATIDEVFSEMSQKHSVFEGLTLHSIGGQGVQLQNWGQA